MATDGRVLAYNPPFVTGLTPGRAGRRAGPRGDALRPGPPRPPRAAATRRGGTWPATWPSTRSCSQAGFVLPAGRLMPGEGTYAAPAAGQVGRGVLRPPRPTAGRPAADGRRRAGDGARPAPTPAGAAAVTDPAGGSPAEAAQAEAEWQVAVAQAERAAPGRGELPAGLGRAVDAVAAPAGRLAGRAARVRLGARPQRLLLGPARTAGSSPQGLYLPGLHSRGTGRRRPRRRHVRLGRRARAGRLRRRGRTPSWPRSTARSPSLYHDTDVQKVQTWRSADGPLVLDPVGGGGTATRCVFDWLDRVGPVPGLRRLPDRPGDRVPRPRPGRARPVGRRRRQPRPTRRSAAASPSAPDRLPGPDRSRDRDHPRPARRRSGPSPAEAPWPAAPAAARPARVPVPSARKASPAAPAARPGRRCQARAARRLRRLRGAGRRALDRPGATLLVPWPSRRPTRRPGRAGGRPKLAGPPGGPTAASRRPSPFDALLPGKQHRVPDPPDDWHPVPAGVPGRPARVRADGGPGADPVRPPPRPGPGPGRPGGRHRRPAGPDLGRVPASRSPTTCWSRPSRCSACRELAGAGDVRVGRTAGAPGRRGRAVGGVAAGRHGRPVPGRGRGRPPAAGRRRVAGIDGRDAGRPARRPARAARGRRRGPPGHPRPGRRGRRPRRGTPDRRGREVLLTRSPAAGPPARVGRRPAGPGPGPGASAATPSGCRRRRQAASSPRATTGRSSPSPSTRPRSSRRPRRATGSPTDAGRPRPHPHPPERRTPVKPHRDRTAARPTAGPTRRRPTRRTRWPRPRPCGPPWPTPPSGPPGWWRR